MKKDYNVADAILHIDPNACCKVKGNDIAAISWNDAANPNNPRPTEAELDAAGVIVGTISDNQIAFDAKKLRDKKIQLKVCIDAGTALGEDMSKEQTEFNAL